MLSNRYERLESIARGKVDSTWLFVNACLPLFFSLSLSLIQLLLSIHKRRTIIDFLAKVLPFTRDAYFSLRINEERI